MTVAVEEVLAESSLSATSERRWSWTRSWKIRVGGAILLFFVLLAIVGPLFAPYNPTATGPDLFAPPSAAHLLGTTSSGQDILSELLVGTRISLLVGFTAAAIGEGLAIIIGITAGFVGGVAAEALSMLTNIFLVIPVLPLEILLASYLSGAGWLGITLIISITAWPWGARTLRAQTLSIRKRDYVEAARLAGEPLWRLVLVDILPNEIAIIITGFLFHVLFAIVVQTGLAFLGVGSLTTWSWGTILYWAQNGNAVLTGAWWWFLPPGICLALVGMGLALMNLGLDEVINPKLRGRATKRPRLAIGRLRGLLPRFA
jgi:peptide/nickel transport system permease protein